MTMLHSAVFDMLVAPYLQYPFMARALAACVVLSISAAPIGIFMTLRRMTLVGDAMSHAILPGVAIAFLAFGFSAWAMSVGGLLFGVLVAVAASFLTRTTLMKEDSSFALLYLLSLAGGMMIISSGGSNLDLVHILFGNVLGIDRAALLQIAFIAGANILGLAMIYRGLVIACFDPEFLQATGRGRSPVHLIFFILLVMNLVASFQAMGTLMALGLMILPALAVRFWTQRLDTSLLLAIIITMIGAYIGLTISFYVQLPSGPMVVMVLGGVVILSALFGRFGSIRRYLSI